MAQGLGKEDGEGSDDMTLIVETSDFQPNGHIVEAAFDAFKVEEGGVVNTFELQEQVELNAYPNPFNNQFTVTYQFKEAFNQAYIHIHNALGQRLQSIQLGAQAGTLQLGDQLEAGVYFLQVEADGKLDQATRVIKF